MEVCATYVVTMYVDTNDVVAQGQVSKYSNSLRGCGM